MTLNQHRWNILAATILLVALVTLTITVSRKVRELPFTEKAGRSSVFVPSPYELMMMGSKELWPRSFSMRSPPDLDDLPSIYSQYLRLHPRRSAEVNFFRGIAVASTLADWKSFREQSYIRLDLKSPEEVSAGSLLSFSEKEDCSVGGLEYAYRATVWDRSVLPRALKIFSRCEPEAFHALWFRVVLAADKKDAKALQLLSEEIQTRQKRVAEDSFEFFLLNQAFAVVDLKLAHPSG